MLKYKDLLELIILVIAGLVVIVFIGLNVLNILRNWGII